MFRYLLFCGLGLYLVLLIGGEDRGQERAGLRGAYAIDLAAPAPIGEPGTPAAETSRSAAAVPPAQLPAATLRVLPAPQPALLQTAAADPAPAPDSPAMPLLTVTADAANVRDGASRAAAVIGRLERGESVQLVEEVGDWVHVRIEGDGVEGFVHRRLLSADAPALSTYSLFPAAD